VPPQRISGRQSFGSPDKFFDGLWLTWAANSCIGSYTSPHPEHAGEPTAGGPLGCSVPRGSRSDAVHGPPSRDSRDPHPPRRNAVRLPLKHRLPQRSHQMDPRSNLRQNKLAAPHSSSEGRAGNPSHIFRQGSRSASLEAAGRARGTAQTRRRRTPQAQIRTGGPDAK